MIFTSRDIGRTLKKKSGDELYIGCFLIEKSHLVAGVFNADVVLNGLGVLIEFGDSIHAGNFRDSKL